MTPEERKAILEHLAAALAELDKLRPLGVTVTVDSSSNRRYQLPRVELVVRLPKPPTERYVPGIGR